MLSLWKAGKRNNNKLVESDRNHFSTKWKERHGDIFAPLSIDVKEDADNVMVQADVAGIDKKDIRVTYDNGLLSISGEYREENADKKSDYHLIERRFGRFQRSIGISEKYIDQDSISAKVKNGVLSVSMKKRKNQSGKSIEIK